MKFIVSDTIALEGSCLLLLFADSELDKDVIAVDLAVIEDDALERFTESAATVDDNVGDGDAFNVDNVFNFLIPWLPSSMSVSSLFALTLLLL